MEPKTKLQKEVVKLSNELPDLTPAQVEYAKEKLFRHHATLLKSGKLTCLDCGHSWQNDGPELGAKILGVTCPSCERKLEVNRTRRKIFYEEHYYQIITTFKGYQVLRMFQVSKDFIAGKPQDFYLGKLYENWITPDGKSVNIGRYLIPGYYGQWTGDYEVRPKNAATDYGIHLDNKYIYPKKKFIPILKRNGLKTSFHGANPLTVCIALIKNPKAETLLKAKQYSLLRNIESERIYMYWPSIKICLRNNYVVKDAGTWFDYLYLLRHFGKDLHNAKYVCPEDLDREHNRLVEKRRNIDRKENIARQRREVAAEQKKYAEQKKAFMGLEFSKGNLRIKFINSVQEVMEEGDQLKHCVFTNGYHKGKSLLFSALVNGKRVATIQVDPDRMEVVQCRGMSNQIPRQDKRIRDLMERNMNKIRERTFNNQLKQAS